MLLEDRGEVRAVAAMERADEAVFGVIPILSGGARVELCAVGLVMFVIAVGVINAR